MQCLYDDIDNVEYNSQIVTIVEDIRTVLKVLTLLTDS
jgi:hypothetical protein